MKNNLLIFIFLQCEIYPLSLTEKKTYLQVEFTLLSYEKHPLYFSHSWYVIPPHQLGIESRNILYMKFIP